MSPCQQCTYPPRVCRADSWPALLKRGGFPCNLQFLSPEGVVSPGYYVGTGRKYTVGAFGQYAVALGGIFTVYYHEIGAVFFFQRGQTVQKHVASGRTYNVPYKKCSQPFQILKTQITGITPSAVSRQPTMTKYGLKPHKTCLNSIRAVGLRQYRYYNTAYNISQARIEWAETAGRQNIRKNIRPDDKAGAFTDP